MCGMGRGWQRERGKGGVVSLGTGVLRGERLSDGLMSSFFVFCYGRGVVWGRISYVSLVDADIDIAP